MYAVSESTDYGISVADITIVAETNKDLGNLVLKKTGSIGAIVRLASNNISNLSGTDLYIPGTSFNAKTDKDGRVILDGLPVGEYLVRVERPGVKPAEFANVTVQEDQITWLPVADTVLSISPGPEGYFSIESLGTFLYNNVQYELVGSTDLTVELFYDNEAALYRLSDSGEFTGASNKNVQATDESSLTGEGPHEIYVQYSDLNGQESSVSSERVFVDTGAPSIDSLSVYGGLNQTVSQAVYVDITCSDAGSGIKDYIISEQESFADSEWTSISDNSCGRVPLMLTSGTGNKTIYVKPRDKANNVSTTMSTSIELAASAEGKIWSESVAFLNSTSSRNSLSIDVRGGYAIASFVEQVSESAEDLKTTRFQPGGSRTPAVTMEANVDYQGRRPLVRLNNLGGAMLVMARFQGNVRPSYYAMNQSDPTANWSNFVEIDLLERDWSVDAVVDSNNNFHVVMEQWGGAFGNIYYNRYDASSESWGSPTVLETSNGYATQGRVRVDSADNVYAFWSREDWATWFSSSWRYEPYWTVFDDISGTWSGEQAITPQIAVGSGTERLMDVHVAANDDIWILWCQDDWYYSDHPVFVRQYAAATDTWGAVDRLLLPVTITASNQYLDFSSDNGSFTAVIPAQTYRDHLELMAAVETAMEAVDTAVNYAVTLEHDTSKIEIEALNSTVFTLDWSSGANSATSIASSLGFTGSSDGTGQTKYTADTSMTNKVNCAADAAVRTDSNNNPVVAWIDQDEAVHIREHNGTSWLAAETINSFDSSTMIRNLNLIVDGSDYWHVAYDTKRSKNLRVWAHRHYSGTWDPPQLVDNFTIEGLSDATEELSKFNPSSVLAILPDGKPTVFWTTFNYEGIVPSLRTSSFE